MSPPEAAALVAAGLAAGVINAVAGSGTLITFPALLAAGYAPVVANVSNTVGLYLGTVAGIYGYRAELAGQRARLQRLAPGSIAGAATGAVLLMVLPGSAFETVVPVLIGLAVALVLAGPAITAHLPGRPDARTGSGGWGLMVGVFAAGVYGGYFGAAQGVLLIGLLGIALRDDLQRVNAAKNVLAAMVNGVAAIMFMVVAEVAWAPALLLAVGSAAGGLLGARYGRHLPPAGLRAIVAVVGVAAMFSLLSG